MSLSPEYGYSRCPKCGKDVIAWWSHSSNEMVLNPHGCGVRPKPDKEKPRQPPAE